MTSSVRHPLNTPIRSVMAFSAPTASQLRRSTVAVASATLVSVAFAQAEKPADTPKGDAPAATEKAEAQTITVTATRRREPLRDVPLRVETLRADQLERSGAASLSDYVGGIPGVDVKSDGGPGRGQVSIRGISATSDQTSVTAGIYIDDVAFGSSSGFVSGATSALDMSLLDLHHIEILRGPQGTLYGAGAMGGLLKYVTNEPDSNAFSGKVSLGLRSVRQGGVGHTESMVLNVPLSQDVAGLRVAAFNDHEGGFIKTVGLAAGNKVNDGNTRGARVSLLVEPISRLKVRLTATGQDIKRNGMDYVVYDIATGQPAIGDLTTPLAAREPYEVKIQLLSADVEYNFGWARLNVIGSTQRANTDRILDTTPVFGPVFGLDRVVLRDTLALRKKTAELRLTSPSGTIEWLAGLYHNKETAGFDQLLWGNTVTDATPLELITTGQPTSYKESAAYGDLTYNFGPGWSATVGARVAKNRQNFVALVNGVADPAIQSRDTSKTYLATLRYSLSKESSVYFRAASGYRPGGPNTPALDENGQVVTEAPASYGPDTLWSYELGYKADLLGKRLSLEASLFDIRWSKMQQPVTYGVTSVIINGGNAEVRGFELAGRYRVDDQWSLDGNFAYTDAKLTEDAASLGAAGSRLPNTPKVAATLGARYAFALAGHPSYAGVNVRRVGQRNAGFDLPTSSLPNFSLPAYTQVDAQWGIEFGAWQLATFVKNLTDKRALLGADTTRLNVGFPLRATVSQPRTVGATLTMAF